MKSIIRQIMKFYPSDMVGGKSNINNFTLSAKACLPIISAIFVEIKGKTYPRRCFVNIDLPSNVLSHKGYKLTKQGTSIVRTGWRQVTSEAQGGKMLSTMTMETNSSASATIDESALLSDQLLFKREVTGSQVIDDDSDYCSLQDGYITVTPLGALTNADMDCQKYFREWLPCVAEHSSSSAL